MNILRSSALYPLGLGARSRVLSRGAVAGLTAALVLAPTGPTEAVAVTRTASAPMLEVGPGTPAPVAAADWLPWLGCWMPEGAAGERSARVCILPAQEGVGIEILTVESDEVVNTVRLVADGQRRPVGESGCSGWERAHWSEDGRRVLRRSELECEGDVRRVTSGVLAMLPGNIWLDIQVAGVNGEPYATRALRYQPAETPIPLQRRVAAAVGGRESARAAGRIEAGHPPSADAVIETVEAVGPVVARTLIVERGAGFDLDATTLTALADAGVPGDVTDLMIALTYPEAFDVNRTGPGAVAVGQPTESTARAYDRTPLASPAVGFRPFYGFGRGYFGDCFAPYGGYGIGTFGYGAGCGGFGRGYYGPRYGWSYGGTRVVVVREQRPPVVEEDARFVNGRGYTGGSDEGGRIAVPRDRDRFDGPDIQRSRGSRSSGIGSSGSSVRRAKPRGSSGSSQSGRTAKRRGSGSGSGSGSSGSSSY